MEKKSCAQVFMFISRMNINGIYSTEQKKKKMLNWTEKNKKNKKRELFTHIDLKNQFNFSKGCATIGVLLGQIPLNPANAKVIRCLTLTAATIISKTTVITTTTTTTAVSVLNKYLYSVIQQQLKSYKTLPMGTHSYKPLKVITVYLDSVYR